MADNSSSKVKILIVALTQTKQGCLLKLFDFCMHNNLSSNTDCAK